MAEAPEFENARFNVTCAVVTVREKKQIQVNLKFECKGHVVDIVNSF